VTGGNVQRSIGQDAEAQTTARPNLQYPIASLHAVGALDESDAGHLIHVAHISQQILTTPMTTV
jgi:hypothetical protein